MRKDEFGCSSTILSDKAIELVAIKPIMRVYHEEIVARCDNPTQSGLPAHEITNGVELNVIDQVQPRTKLGVHHQTM